MKHLWLLLLWIGVCSCNTATRPPTEPEPPTLECPTKPETDASGSAELVFSPGKSLKKEVSVTAQKPMAYVFDAKPGYTLNYSVDPSDGICIWLYAPDAEILSEDQFSNLPLSGTYTLQISALSGAENVKLELSLKDPRIVFDPPIEPDSPDESEASTSTLTDTSTLTEDQALQIIQDWLEAKKTIFASPFNKELLSELTVGEKYRKEIGTIRWLTETEKRDCYYRYPSGKAESISFASAKKTLIVDITETTKLYCSSKLNEQTGPNIRRYKAQFELDNGTWKISDISPN